MASGEQAEYEILFTKAADRELKKLEKHDRDRVLEAIGTMAVRPTHEAKMLQKSKKVRERLWRRRVGDFRIIFSLVKKPKGVKILSVRHRREDTYEGLEHLV